ncbi:hypothetical protein IJ818_01580 [bacterium]|nr:hypothetical protein [bacterium]
MIKYNELIDKIIEKTENNTLIWEKDLKVPNCVVFSAENVTKIFHTKINNQMKFYLIEFSYYAYSPEFDEKYIDYSIMGSFIQNDVEIESFGRGNLITPNKMNELMELVINKYFNKEQQFDDFLNS